MNTVNFELKMEADLDAVWEQLTYFGCELLYSTEDDHEKVIIGHLPKNMRRQQLLENIPELKDIKQSSLAIIDWEGQWATHGIGYREGYVHVDLRDYVAIDASLNLEQIQLKAGPGFGDLSHPTTRLTLRLMAPQVFGKHVVDIGSGSGILSLAAYAMGASSVEGIDIDPAALLHASENSKLNGMETQISFLLPEDFEMTQETLPNLLLMNMIQSEQTQAWNALEILHSIRPMTVITSGILMEDRQRYLDQTSVWGWQLIEEIQEDGWGAFHFELKSTVV